MSRLNFNILFKKERAFNDIINSLNIVEVPSYNINPNFPIFLDIFEN